MSSIFNHFDPVYIISFLSAFKAPLDTNRINEGAAMWLLQLFMKKQAEATLSSRIALRSKSSRKCQIEGTLKTYYEVVYYLLETRDTDNVIFKPNAEIMRVPQPLNKTLFVYSELFGAKELRWHRFYDEYVPKGNFT